MDNIEKTLALLTDTTNALNQNNNTSNRQFTFLNEIVKNFTSISSLSGTFSFPLVKLTGPGTNGSVTLTIQQGLITKLTIVQPT